MTNRELAEIIATAENKTAYASASDKSWFVQDLIEAQGIQTYPASPLCDYIEDTLEA